MNDSLSQISSKATDTAEAKSKALQFLLHSRSDKQIWFPYSPNGECSLEATAWSLIALRHEEKIVRPGLAYLADCQNTSDGGWSTKPGAGKSDWTSGSVFLCLRLLSELYPQCQTAKIKKAIARAFTFLVDNRVEFYGPTARLLLLMSKGPESLSYGRGWPWDPKCFHWVEPTSYFLLALKLPHPPAQEIQLQSIKFADKFILEHACRGGGWNHGNDLTLGAYLPPYRWTTAEALLALQDCTPEPKIVQALTYLKSLKDQDSSSLSLALSILALAAYNQPFKSELQFLKKRQTESGNFGPTILTTALAILALQAAEDDQILKFTKAKEQN